MDISKTSQFGRRELHHNNEMLLTHARQRFWCSLTALKKTSQKEQLKNSLHIRQYQDRDSHKIEEMLQGKTPEEKYEA